MENQQPAEGPQKKDKGFTLFAAKRIVLGIAGVLVLLLGASYLLNKFESHEPRLTSEADHEVAARTPTDDVHGDTGTPEHAAQPGDPHAAEPGHGEQAAAVASHDEPTDSHSPSPSQKEADSHGSPSTETDAHRTAVKTHAADADAHSAPAGEDHGTPATDAHAPEAGHGDADADAHGGGGHGHGSIQVSDVPGVTFVMAAMAPLHYELEERFYGWRPNDALQPTDNVENYQLGVLEVTRRTVEALTERISRTGSAQAFDPDLEKARNKLMINADDYMLPSAESSYGEALELLARYKAKLENGTAPFFTRTVNLIPLLVAYENLLGSCDDNLVKAKEDDGRDVSWFRADDYFYYAQGVAGAMHTILQAVAVDFARVLESRRGDDVLHHAIEALHHATAIKPLIILDGAPDGFTANHRANLAAPISHARFYVGLLIQTLST